MHAERTVEVKVIGRLWMPSCLAACHETFKVGPGPFRREIHDLDDAETAMLDACRDLQGPQDYQIVYHVSRTYPAHDGIGHTTHCRSRVARDWAKADSEDVWADCMFPPEEE